MVELKPIGPATGTSACSQTANNTAPISRIMDVAVDAVHTEFKQNQSTSPIPIFGKQKEAIARARLEIINQLSSKASNHKPPKKIVLPNGLTIIADEVPDTDFCNVRVAVKVGTIHEKKTNRGIAHFIEHTVFKGTNSEDRLTAYALNRELEGLGTAEKLNAQTDVESTEYYAEVLGDFAPYVLDAFLDILSNPRFDEGELEKEKNVIIEEIKQYNDSPQDFITDRLHQYVWRHPMGRPTLGTKESVRSLKRDALLEFMNDFYTPDNMIISVAGNFDLNNIIEVANKYTAHIERKKKPKEIPELKYKPGTLIYKRRDIEQTHLIFATEGISFTSEDWFTLAVLEKSLATLFTSRLYSDIRENAGLAYTVTSENSQYAKGGTFGVYTAIPGEKLDYVLTLILTQLKDIKDNGLTQEEMEIAKINLISEHVKDNESIEKRAERNVSDEIYFGKSISLKNDIEGIQAVTNEQIISLAQKLFKPALFTLAIVGPKEEEEEENDQLPTRQKLQAIIDKFARNWDEPLQPKPVETIEPKAA